MEEIDVAKKYKTSDGHEVDLKEIIQTSKIGSFEKSIKYVGDVWTVSFLRTNVVWDRFGKCLEMGKLVRYRYDESARRPWDLNLVEQPSFKIISVGNKHENFIVVNYFGTSIHLNKAFKWLSTDKDGTIKAWLSKPGYINDTMWFAAQHFDVEMGFVEFNGYAKDSLMEIKG